MKEEVKRCILERKALTQRHMLKERCGCLVGLMVHEVKRDCEAKSCEELTDYGGNFSQNERTLVPEDVKVDLPTQGIVGMWGVPGVSMCNRQHLW